MMVAHYGYLVLKMLSPNSVLKIHGDCDAGVFVLEKLQDLAMYCEAVTGPGSLDLTTLRSGQRGSTSAPHVRPSNHEGVPVKTIQIGADAAHTTHTAGDLDNK
jgi:hypothetical protein